MVVGAVIVPGVVVHLTAADIHVDYDALLIVQSSKARQYGDLGRSCSLRALKNYVLHRIATGRYVCVCVSGRCVLVVGVCVYVCV